jgi:hypothetical protein
VAVGYAKTLNLDMQFVIDSLMTPSSEILLVNTVGMLRSLSIHTTGLPRVKTITNEMAMNLCNYATD